jgi:antirestriction protein ArdC
MDETRARERRVAERERLRRAVAELSSGAGFRRWLEVRAAMHEYSLHNTILIAMQRPDATCVAGYRKWQSLGRQVRRGERAIRILAPRRVKVVDEESGEEGQRVAGFIGVSVFDVSQTEGEPLGEPPRPAPIDGDSRADLIEPLEAFARRRGYGVVRERLPEGMGGWCDLDAARIALSESLSPNGEVRTLIHELAHTYWIDYRRYERGVAEAIVEAATAISCRSLGLDTDLASVPYIAGWADGNAEVISEQAEMIDRIARELTEAAENGHGREEDG